MDPLGAQSVLDDLSLFGPIFVLKLPFVPDEFGRRAVAEMWFHPDAWWMLELSTKCAPSEIFQVAMEGKAFLTRRGVDRSGRAADEVEDGSNTLQGPPGW